jgi:hypothetical protein
MDLKLHLGLVGCARTTWENEMRSFLILAAAVSLTAGAAQARYQGYAGYQGYQPPGIPKASTAGGFKPYEPPTTGGFKPYEPPKASADPFSPAGEAARQRREEAAERARANGVFSPSGEAKRQREQAKRDKANSPF